MYQPSCSLELSSCTTTGFKKQAELNHCFNTKKNPDLMVTLSITLYKSTKPTGSDFLL